MDIKMVCALTHIGDEEQVRKQEKGLIKKVMHITVTRIITTTKTTVARRHVWMKKKVKSQRRPEEKKFFN